MQNPMAPQIDIGRYLRLLWKRKWLILLPTILFPGAAAYWAMQQPDSFKSTTLILVQPQRVPAQFVQSTVTTGIQERLHTISQQIFSRTRLEQIIQEFGLFPEERQTRTPEEVTETMRGRIKLSVHRNDAFQLAFVDQNPRLAMLVANKLASLFIEENLKVREQQAIGTSQFLGDEIDRYREQVRQREAEILAFKRKHMAEMPEQLAASQARLGQLQSQLQINAQSINSAEDRRVQLQQQLAEIEQRVQEERVSARGSETRSETRGPSISEMLMAQFQQADPGGGAVAAPVDESKLRALEGELAKRRQALEALLISLTPKHPDAVRLQGEVEKIEAKVAEERARVEAEKAKALAAIPPPPPAPEPAAPAPEPPAPSQSSAEPPLRYPAMYERLKADLARTDADIVRLSAQTGEIQGAIEGLQGRVAATPARQLQLQQLSEDYDNLKGVLEGLINKKLQADLSENLERKQKGEQFKILDPANLPVKPFSPNRQRVVAMGLLVGLILGLGTVLLMDFLDWSVKSKPDLGSVVNAPVLGVIPVILTTGDLRRQWAWRLGASGALVACLVVAAGVVHWQVKPLPRAVGDLISQARATHWTTMK